MTLDEFIKETRERLIKFEQAWKVINAIKPDAYPNELEPGEWDEQFMIFNEVDDEIGS